MKKSVFTSKNYMIVLGINLLSLIFWFMPAINLRYLIEKDFTLSQIVENLDAPVLSVVHVFYIIAVIAGTLLAALPLIKKFFGIAAVPDIKDGLFINLQGAPFVHAILVLLYYFVYSNNQRQVEVTLCFGGIMALLLGICCVIALCVLNAKYKKYKKSLANEREANTGV